MKIKWLDKLLDGKKPKRKKIKIYEDEYLALKGQCIFFYKENKRLREKLKNE